MIEQRTFKQARVATSISFLLNGLGQGSFISRIPDLKHQLNISNSLLGFSLFFGAAGVISAMPVAGWLCAKYGSGPATRFLNFFLIITPPLIGMSFGVIWFCIALFVNGFLYAAQDVAMNAHGSTLEINYGKRIMSGLHALWSTGTFIGGAIGGLATQLKIKPVFHFSAIAISILVISVLINKSYLVGEIDKHALEHRVKQKRPRIFFILGLLGLCAAIGEGAASDWGGVLIRDTFEATGFMVALPYIFFSTTMVLGRLSGDFLAHRFGSRNLISGAAFIAGAGLTSGLLIGGELGILFAWLLSGIGLSVILPILFSSGGSIADQKYKNRISGGEAIAIVSGVSYFGFVFGPPLIGSVADLISLRWALLIPAGLALFLSITARKVLHNN